ncbi:MAG: hydantoinase/oxoprolinase family protein [Candidatus Eisenbacteria bacterium]|nr:hydantoinase/oxoprolinase family protein [Candidatus Eisenbacteria bacterium]
MKRVRRAAARAIGVDTGGTFTDFVAVAGGRLVVLKVPSTPRAPERAVLEGLARLGAGRGTRVRHGSTVATNALLERAGARVALVTTAGFEDLLEIGRQDRPDLYALAPRRVEPLVPAARRLGVRERMGPAGAALVPLTAAAARRAAAAVGRSRAEAVAVGLLHSYANPAHERRLARALARLGVPVTLSATLCPEVREYERFATAVTNAYLTPRVSTYLDGLSCGTPARLEIVLSHGGTAPPALAVREPVRQLLSGPAAGLAAAFQVARACGFERALTLDVGGTSTDCAYVAGGLPRRRAREVAGFPVLLPVLDVHTVGAGGGSIARVDQGGLLHVGPGSAGADPGPACYGRGGPATVTDALVVLGRIPGEALAGGALALDRAAATRVLGPVARRLGYRVPAAAAEGILAIADARMEAALRKVSVEQAHDPRGAALVAFGGAGGLHACALAGALGCDAVLFPLHAGVLSALGALAGGSRREKSRSVLLDARETAALERAWRALEHAVRAEFAPGERRGLGVERWAEVRYRGQSHEIAMPGGRDLEGRFHAEHERRYGYAERARGVEVVTIEVRAGTPPGWDRLDLAPPRAARGVRPARQRVRHEGRWLAAAVWPRPAVPRARPLRGPAIVTDQGATLWIAPGWSARVHPTGTLVLGRTP